jgi:hypothetical protein
MISTEIPFLKIKEFLALFGWPNLSVSSPSLQEIFLTKISSNFFYGMVLIFCTIGVGHQQMRIREKNSKNRISRTR